MFDLEKKSRRRRNRPAAWIVILGLSCAAAAAQPAGRTFQAGAALANISPWSGISINGNMQDHRVERIHDELHARALVLDDGRQRLALVIVDSCMVPRPIYDRAKRIIERETGIAPGQILMAATHTHSAGTAAPVFQSLADDDYAEFLSLRIAGAVRQAAGRLQPARIGWGLGSVPQHVFNRRWKMKPGTPLPNPFGGADQVKMNPPDGSPDLLEPAGPVDPELSVLSLRRADGEPLAVLASYSMHYAGGVPQGEISADYFAVFAGRIKEYLQAGPDFVGIMANGTSANIGRDHSRPSPTRAPYERMQQVGSDIAREAARVIGSLTHHEWVPLGSAQAELQLGVRRPDRQELLRAKRIVMGAEGPVMRSLEEIYARESLFMADYPAQVPLILQALRIGDLAVNAIPCEVFVEIGLELKQKSPFAQTFTIPLANGYNGYLPTVEHHRLGGYETWRARSSYLEAGAAPPVVAELLRLLQSLRH